MNQFNQTDAKVQLKKIGEQIESIAKTWKSQGASFDSESLYEIGNRVEHFLDNAQDDKANLEFRASEDQKDRLS